MRPSLRAVLFDAAGTLIEPVEPIGETYARFARAAGVELSPDSLERAFRAAFARSGPRPRSTQRSVGDRGNRALEVATTVREEERAWWRALVAEVFRAARAEAKSPNLGPHSGPSPQVDPTFLPNDLPNDPLNDLPNDPLNDLPNDEAVFDRLFSHFAGREAWRLRPGARPLLERLRRHGLALGIISNFDHRLLEILESLELAAFFAVIVIPGTHGAEKPDARVFRAALEAVGCSPEEALYVGDDAERDLAGASAAGLEAFDVRWLASLTDLPERVATLRAALAQDDASTREIPSTRSRS